MTEEKKRYEARQVDWSMSTNCCFYAVVDLERGVEICRVWQPDRALEIARLLEEERNWPGVRRAAEYVVLNAVRIPGDEYNYAVPITMLETLNKLLNDPLLKRSKALEILVRESIIDAKDAIDHCRSSENQS